MWVWIYQFLGVDLSLGSDIGTSFAAIRTPFLINNVCLFLTPFFYSHICISPHIILPFPSYRMAYRMYRDMFFYRQLVSP